MPMSHHAQPSGPLYACPMHPDIFKAGPGKCPDCGMDLLPEGTRFAMARHMMAGPMPFVVGGVALLAIVTATMLLR